jgi:hypothetical protein
MRACPLSGEVLSTAPNAMICVPSGLAANVRFCRIEGVLQLHADTRLRIAIP